MCKLSVVLPHLGREMDTRVKSTVLCFLVRCPDSNTTSVHFHFPSDRNQKEMLALTGLSEGLFLFEKPLQC